MSAPISFLLLLLFFFFALAFCFSTFVAVAICPTPLLSLCPYVFTLMLYHLESHLFLLSLALFFSVFSSIQSDFFSPLVDSALTQHPPNLTSRSIFLKFTQTYISNTPHPLSSPSSDCTCVPGFGLDAAQVASVESGKCSSCPICHLEQVDRRRRGGRSKVLFG